MSLAVGYDKQIKQIIRKAKEEQKAAAARVGKALSEKNRIDEVEMPGTDRPLPK